MIYGNHTDEEWEELGKQADDLREQARQDRPFPKAQV